jgi:hypothetical protein
MKKIIAMVLVVSLMLGAVPVSAAKVQVSLEEATAFVLELLSEESVAAFNEFDEELFSVTMEWAYEELADFNDNDDDFLFELRLLVEHINAAPARNVRDIVEWLSFIGRWGEPNEFDFSPHVPTITVAQQTAWDELTAQFVFGTNVTRQDVAAVTEAVLSYFIEVENFNMRELLAAAQLTEAQLVDMLYAMLEINDAADDMFRWYGEEWLSVFVYEFFVNIRYEVQWEGEEYAVNLLHVLWVVYAETTRVLGAENAGEFFDDAFSSFFMFLDDDEILEAIASGGQFISTMERLVAQYGADGFLRLFDFDFYEAVETLIAGGTPPRGFTYADELLGGLFSEYIDYFAEIIEWERERDALWAEQEAVHINFERTIDSLIYFMDFIFYESSLSLTAQDSELKIIYEIDQPSIYFFEIYESNNRLNLFYENESQNDVSFTYFVFGFDNMHASMESVELAPGERFTVQINFADMPREFYRLVAVVINGDDDVDGTFSLRLTDFELGHPSHG